MKKEERKIMLREPQTSYPLSNNIKDDERKTELHWNMRENRSTLVLARNNEGKFLTYESGNILYLITLHLNDDCSFKRDNDLNIVFSGTPLTARITKEVLICSCLPLFKNNSLVFKVENELQSGVPKSKVIMLKDINYSNEEYIILSNINSRYKASKYKDIKDLLETALELGPAMFRNLCLETIKEHTSKDVIAKTAGSTFEEKVLNLFEEYLN